MEIGNLPKRVAITGALSCGKSTVCQIFKDLGAYTVSADAIVHELLVPKSPIGKQVIALFGSEIVVDEPSGEKRFARSKIASIAFQNPELLRSLENLLHPAVHEEIEKHYRYAASLSFPLFVAEIPLLFEVGEDRYYDKTVVVSASQERCLKRFEGNFSGGKQEYYKRMARQLNPQIKASKASYIIDNDGSLAETRAAVTNIYAEMLPNNPKGV